MLPDKSIINIISREEKYSLALKRDFAGKPPGQLERERERVREQVERWCVREQLEREREQLERDQPERERERAVTQYRERFERALREQLARTPPHHRAQVELERRAQLERTVSRYLAQFEREPLEHERAAPQPRIRKVKQRVLTARLRDRLRGRINAALRGASADPAAALDLLGVESIEFYKAHLESMFLPGMTWDNAGAEWHIDHAVTLESYGNALADPAVQREAFHHLNTRPMWARDNLTRRWNLRACDDFPAYTPGEAYRT